MLRTRIPTILGIFLLLVGITAGVYLVELGPQPLTTRATPEVFSPPQPLIEPLAKPTSSPEDLESQFSFESFPEPSTETTVTIDSPGEGEEINTQVPEIFGGGPPGATLEIVVQSESEILDRVTVDGQGQWSWVPSTSLSSGEHFITLRWLDENGITRSLTRSFVVYAQGESSLPSFEATPSATGTPTPTPTPIEIAAVSPTPTPTRAPTPTPVPAASPSTTATEPSLPVPGSGSFSLWILFTGLMLVGLGTFSSLRRWSP